MDQRVVERHINGLTTREIFSRDPRRHQDADVMINMQEGNLPFFPPQNVKYLKRFDQQGRKRNAIKRTVSTRSKYLSRR
jgi:hypothetical protein